MRLAKIRLVVLMLVFFFFSRAVCSRSLSCPRFPSFAVLISFLGFRLCPFIFSYSLFRVASSSPPSPLPTVFSHLFRAGEITLNKSVQTLESSRSAIYLSASRMNARRQSVASGKTPAPFSCPTFVEFIPFSPSFFLFSSFLFFFFFLSWV